MSIYRDKKWLKQTLIGGIILLLCPPLGWILAMGYRRAFGQSYVTSVREDSDFVWPKWQNIGLIFVDGIKVWGVIGTYLLPSLIVGWGIILWRSGIGSEQCIAFGAFLIASIVLLPVGLPASIVWLYKHYDWFVLSTYEVVIVTLFFLCGIFLIPSGFVRVSCGDSFIDALPTKGNWKLVLEEPVAYCRAWIISLLCCLGVVFLGPLAPFGIFWSYQATAKIFADVALAANGKTLE